MVIKQVKAHPWAVIVFALALNCTRLFQVGRAGAESSWDDVGYFIGSADRSSILLNEGFIPWVVSFYTTPFHAPVIELLAGLSFLLFGKNEAIVYIAHSVVIYFLLFIIFRDLKTKYSNHIVLLITSIVFVSPLGIFLCNEYKPESIFYLVLTKILVNVRSMKLLKEEPKLVNETYMWLILLLYIKPTFLMMTLILLLVLTVMVISFNSGKIVKGNLSLKHLLPSLFALLPFIVLILPSTVQYVEKVRFGSDSKYWVNQNQVSVFMGNLELGFMQLGWVPLIAGIGLFFALVNVSKLNIKLQLREKPLFSVYIAILFLATFYSSMNSIYFGLIPLIPLCIVSINYGIQKIGKILSPHHLLENLGFLKKLKHLKVPAAGMAIFIAAYATPFTYGNYIQELRKPLSLNTRILDAIISDCVSDQVCSSKYFKQNRIPLIAVATINVGIDARYMSWIATKKGFGGFVESATFSSDDSWFKNASSSSNYLVLGDQSKLLNSAYMTTLLGPKWLDSIKTDSLWREVIIPGVTPDFRLFSRVNQL